jgi:hypothetical protein
MMNETFIAPALNLTEHGRDVIYPIFQQLIKEAGLEFMQNVVCEIKYKPEGEMDSDEEEKAELKKKEDETKA